MRSTARRIGSSRIGVVIASRASQLVVAPAVVIYMSCTRTQTPFHPLAAANSHFTAKALLHRPLTCTFDPPSSPLARSLRSTQSQLKIRFDSYTSRNVSIYFRFVIELRIKLKAKFMGCIKVTANRTNKKSALTTTWPPPQALRLNSRLRRHCHQRPAHAQLLVPRAATA